MLTVALVVTGSIIGAAGLAFAMWSILDTNREYQRRKRGIGS